MLRRPFLFAVAFGVATWLSIALITTFLNDNGTWGAVKDMLALPGALVASLIYPQGVHTGMGAPVWATVVILSNLIIYILLWYSALKVARLVYTRTNEHRG